MSRKLIVYSILLWATCDKKQLFGHHFNSIFDISFFLYMSPCINWLKGVFWICCFLILIKCPTRVWRNHIRKMQINGNKLKGHFHGVCFMGLHPNWSPGSGYGYESSMSTCVCLSMRSWHLSGIWLVQCVPARRQVCLFSSLTHTHALIKTLAYSLFSLICSLEGSHGTQRLPRLCVCGDHRDVYSYICMLVLFVKNVIC